MELHSVTQTIDDSMQQERLILAHLWCHMIRHIRFQHVNRLADRYDDNCHPVFPATLAHVWAPHLMKANFCRPYHSSVP